MAGNTSKWFGAIGLSAFLVGGCASYRNECGVACSNDSPPASSARSIFNWRNAARSNQPTALTITATKPETRAAENKPSLLVEAPAAGSKFNPVASAKPRNSTENRSPEKSIRSQSVASEAEPPVISKPLGMPIPKAKSNGSQFAAGSPPPPKPLDLTSRPSAEPAAPKKLPPMASRESVADSVAAEEHVHTLASQHALRPAKPALERLKMVGLSPPEDQRIRR